MEYSLVSRGFLHSVALVVAFCLAVAAARSATAARARPNIVLLYADDLGWTDLGCYGSGYYETPSIDRLCKQGMRFTDAYSPAANCAPARACLLSGQYAPRHGTYTVGSKNRFDVKPKLLKWRQRKLLAPENQQGLPAAKTTIAEVLKTAGYTCGVFGKWHLGDRNPETQPKNQGFDVAWFKTGGSHWDMRVMPKPDPMPEKGTYRSDWMADRAIEFIRANRDRPFFLYFPDYLVHVPLEGKEELVAKYKAKEPVGGHRNPVYAAMIEALDSSCGRILRALDEAGVADDTLVLFFSDNGGCGSAKNRGLSHEGGLTSNAPLRGMKGMLYDGGIRVPMIARWPGVIQPGSTCSVPVIGVDLFPTFMAVAGLDSAAVPATQPLDGESMLPLLKSSVATLRRTDIFWWMPGYLPGRQAPANVMRSGPWKLIENFEDNSIELYNLNNDIGERENVAETLPDRTAELHARLRQWRKDVGAVVPERNPDFDPKNDGRW